MNIAAIFQWISLNTVVPWLFLLLMWKELLAAVRFLYAERQKRLIQHSNNAVKMSDNQLEETRLTTQNGGASST